MKIRVGLTTGDLVQMRHQSLGLRSHSGLDAIMSGVAVRKFEPNREITISSHAGVLVIKDQESEFKSGQALRIRSQRPSESLVFSSTGTSKSVAKSSTPYQGTLHIVAIGNAMRVVLETDLESYVQGVLQSEVPSYFNIEAMKAQAVLARTYGLRPRLPHTDDDCNVCDSFLHCQAFYGVRSLTALQKVAITSTKGEVLLFGGKPALALFSACAGGHTESYQNCFSDPITNEFPPAPLSYLTGVAEGKLPRAYPSEAGLRQLFAEPSPDTVDAWSKTSFRWTAKFGANALEAHMHHVIEKLQDEAQFGPFIKAPASGKFGHIQRFEIPNRGVAGTAIRLLVHTSTGTWSIEKELTIRSIFENSELKVKRLKSARIFFDESQDSLGLLKSVVVHGFGSGHGVGLQQVGAHGWALKGLTYRQIIAHYYKGTEIGTL